MSKNSNFLSSLTMALLSSVKHKNDELQTKLKEELTNELKEVDFVGSGALDMVSFSTAIAGMWENYSSHQSEISEKVWKDQRLNKDDAGKLSKIEDIVEFVTMGDGQHISNLRYGLGFESMLFSTIDIIQPYLT